MEAFLETQRVVLDAYRATRLCPSAPRLAPESRPMVAEPGPWVGTLESLNPGRALVAVRSLDLHDDPVAEHHTLGGRRVSALDPDRKGLPVVPFTVMAEMLAQAASVLMPDREVVALRDVQAYKWIRYEEDPVALEIRAVRDPDRQDEVRVEIHNKGRESAVRPGAEGRRSRARSWQVASSSATLARRARWQPRSSWRGRALANSPPRSSTPTSGSSTAQSCKRWSGWGRRRRAGSRGR